jgi:CysZ protein
MIEVFLKGAGYALAGLRWLPRPQLRRFVVLPLMINVLLFGGLIAWGAQEFGLFLDWALGYLPAWLDWLRWLLWPLFVITVLLVVFYTFTLVANFIASPFNGLLAERVEALARSQPSVPAGGPLWKEIVRAPVTELTKLGYFLVRALPLLVLFLLPGLNAVAPVLWLAFSAWMLALQYADYPLGNHGLRFREQRRLLGRRRVLALGFGSAVLLLTVVPIVNFLVMPAAVIGATLMWVEQFAPREPSPAPAADV